MEIAQRGREQVRAGLEESAIKAYSDWRSKQGPILNMAAPYKTYMGSITYQNVITADGLQRCICNNKIWWEMRIKMYIGSGSADVANAIIMLFVFEMCWRCSKW